MTSTSDELDPAVARWLTSTDGRDHVASATAALDDGDELLTVATRLRAAGLDASRATTVTGAAQARRRARARWHDADRLLFTPTALEQASDPAVSAWRARRFGGVASVEDRAAGIGGDSLALAAAGPRVTASDTDGGRLVLLAHNAAVRGHEVDTVLADALQRPPPSRGPVHADPARRVGHRRVRRLAEHRPSVPALLDHLAAVRDGPGVAVVLSPAVALEDPELPADAEVEFVQLGPDLVEAVAWTGALRGAPSVRATATMLPRPGTDDPVVSLSRGPRGPRLPVGAIGDVLLDVAPAAVRARLHDHLGAQVGARRIATRRALLTVDGEAPDTPWWRRRRVEVVLPARPAVLRRWLRAADERPLELAVHGADMDLEAFRRALGRPPGGPDGRRIELVRTDRGVLAIVTSALR